MLTISPADLDAPELADFVQAHLDDLASTAPAESRHAFALDGLRAPGVRMWVARDVGRVVGTAALAQVEPGHEEVKSMRTDPRWRGRGVASRLLEHLMCDARSRGVTRLSLETGNMEFFAPARALYAKVGFVPSGPFGSYVEDPNSVCMTMHL